MKQRKFIPPPKSVRNHGLIRTIPLGRLSNVTREAILEGRATFVSCGIEYKLLAQG